MFVKCFTNIPLPPSLYLEIKNSKDNFIPKDVSKAANLLALNDNSYYGFICKF